MGKVAFPELQTVQASSRRSTSLKTFHSTIQGISKADASQEQQL